MSSSNPNDPTNVYRDAKWDGPGDLEFFRSLYKVGPSPLPQPRPRVDYYRSPRRGLSIVATNNLQGWNPVVEALVDAVPYVKTYPNFTGTALSSLVFKGRVALLGDAAHTHGGAFGAGGSLAINDAYAFALALAQSCPPHAFTESKQDPDQLKKALQLYDETRRPLVTRVLSTVHGQGQARRLAATGKMNGGIETDDELRARIAHRPELIWLTEHDVDAEFEAVLARHEE